MFFGCVYLKEREREDSEECVVTVRMSVCRYMCTCVSEGESVCSMCEREIMCMGVCVREIESL